MFSRTIHLLAMTAIVAACATSPTGRSQLMLVSEDYAIQSSKQAYVQMLAPLAREGRIDNSPKTSARVNQITSRLIAQAILVRPETAKWEWSMKIIDDPKVVNAWCMAGGRMAVYTGLLQQVQPSDDELAQVIGHEIAHALAKHQVEKMSVGMATSIGVAVIGIASDSNLAVAGAAAAAALAINLPNSRGAEAEADRIGIELAAKAGYDPRTAATLWRKMEQVSKGKGPPQFLSTHPSAASRIEALTQLAPAMMPYYQAPGPRPVHPL